MEDKILEKTREAIEEHLKIIIRSFYSEKGRHGIDHVSLFKIEVNVAYRWFIHRLFVDRAGAALLYFREKFTMNISTVVFVRSIKY